MKDLFKQVKMYLKPTEVVTYYLGKGTLKADSYWYKSPFRKEKTASFCVNNRKGIHDFGDNTHYDIISFVVKLFEIENMEAVKKIISDFKLPIDLEDEKPSFYRMRDLALYKRKIAKEQAEKVAKQDYYETLFNFSREKFQFWRNLRIELAENRKNLKEVDLKTLYAKEDFYDELCEEILNCSIDEVWENSEMWEELLLWN